MINGRTLRIGWIRGILLTGLIFSVGGCGDTSQSSNTVDTSTYLFYAPADQTSTYSTNYTYKSPNYSTPFGLKAIDPYHPSTPIQVLPTATISRSGATCPTGSTPACTSAPGDVSPFPPVTFLAGNVNSSTRTISDLHYRYVMFTNGARLYRIDAEQSGGLAAAQVSNEAQVVGDPDTPTPGICYSSAQNGTTFAWGITDYANPLDSVFIYRKDPDGSPDCSVLPNNDHLYFVQLKDDSVTAPDADTYSTLYATEPLAPVYNSDGSINSILTYGPNYILRSSVDGAWQQTVYSSTGLTTKPILIGIGKNGDILLAIRDSNTANTMLRKYDPATLTLSAPLYTDTSNTIKPFVASDGTYAYFHDNQKIYRVPFDGSSPASVVADETSFGTGGRIRAGWTITFITTTFNPVPDIRLSGNNVVYIYDDGTSAGGTQATVFVRSVPKSGGTPKTIYTLPDDAETLSWRAAYGRVYLSRYDVKQAISVGDTGASPKVYDQSWWLGFTFNSTSTMFADSSLDSKRKARDMTPKSIFRAQYDSTGNIPAQLVSYDANTGSQLVDFGVPASTFGSYGLGGPPDTLGLTTRGGTLIAYDGSGGGNDVLFLNARSKTSMIVVDRDNPQQTSLVGVNNGGGCSLGNGEFDPLLPAMILLSAIYIWRRRRTWRNKQ